LDAIAEQLDRSGYSRSRHRGLTIWHRSGQQEDSRIIEGDDLRALSALAMHGDRVIVGYNEDAIRAALDAAHGSRASLAEEAVVATANITPDLSGIMVLDQRDLAIRCGVGRGWLESDFHEPSGRELAVLYHVDSTTSHPVTSVWAEYEDELAAEAMLPLLEADWQSGYVNQIGMGGLVSNLATFDAISRVEEYVVADLVDGRENGWTRSGVRYLVAICEQASILIPGGSPVRATPIASPSPVEAT
jgi:hypothetical protein